MYKFLLRIGIAEDSFPPVLVDPPAHLADNIGIERSCIRQREDPRVQGPNALCISDCLSAHEIWKIRPALHIQSGTHSDGNPHSLLSRICPVWHLLLLTDPEDRVGAGATVHASEHSKQCRKTSTTGRDAIGHAYLHHSFPTEHGAGQSVRRYKEARASLHGRDVRH